MLLNKINEDIKIGMKEDNMLLNVARMLKTEVEYKGAKTDDEIIRVVQSMIKKLRDNVELLIKHKKVIAAKVEETEIAILQRYLPEQISDENLVKAVKLAICTVSATSIKDMGKVMGLLKKSLGSSAEPARISRFVKEQLTYLEK